MWGDVQEHLVYTKDVRQVLTFVKEKSVDAGIVYVSDTLGKDHIEVIQRIDDSTHDPIKYYFGIIDGNKHNYAKKKAIENFYQFIIRDESMELL
jgi:molybdate transport system substrate-binding protein